MRDDYTGEVIEDTDDWEFEELPLLYLFNAEDDAYAKGMTEGACAADSKMYSSAAEAIDNDPDFYDAVEQEDGPALMDAWEAGFIVGFGERQDGSDTIESVPTRL